MARLKTDQEEAAVVPPGAAPDLPPSRRMTTPRLGNAVGAALVVLFVFVGVGCREEPRPSPSGALVSAADADPLPSWRDSAARRALISFVARVTPAGGPDFVPPDERVATFDNDGTLWAEKPVPVEVMFAFDQRQDDGAQAS